MSLGDELRMLRAKAGGPTPLEIEEAIGVDASLYCQLEQRYREMGDDETLEKLAAYFASHADTLKRARSRSRKALSRHLSEALDSDATIVLELRTGEKMTGRLVWWDLGALELEPGDGGSPVVIQRHAVVNW